MNLAKVVQIEEDFRFFDDWVDKYQYIIELGTKLTPLSDQYKTEDHRVKGCQSQVWLVSKIKDGKLYYQADSDSSITKGLVALLIDVFSGSTAKEIVESDLGFIERIGLGKHLTPSRANGLFSMVQEIKTLAMKNLEKGKVG